MARTADEARILASDPSTPLAVLYELAQAHPEVHPALALNPSTYPDLLAWLSSLGRADVDAALAARGRGEATGPGAIGGAMAGAVAETATGPTVGSPAEAVTTTASGLPVADEAPAGATVAIPLSQMREAAAPQARSAEDVDESMIDDGPLPERPGLPSVIRLPNSPDEAPSGAAAGPTEILPTRRSRLREEEAGAAAPVAAGTATMEAAGSEPEMAAPVGQSPEPTQAMPAVEDDTPAPTVAEAESTAPVAPETPADAPRDAEEVASPEAPRPAATQPKVTGPESDAPVDAPVDATQAMSPVAAPSPAMPAAILPMGGAAVAGPVAPPIGYPTPVAPSEPTPAVPPQQAPPQQAPPQQAPPQQAPTQVAPPQQPAWQQPAPHQPSPYAPGGQPQRQSVFAPGARPGGASPGTTARTSVYGPGGPGHAPSAPSAPPANWQTQAAPPAYGNQQYGQPAYQQQGGYYGAPPQGRPTKKGLPLAAWIGIGAAVALLVLAAIWFVSLMGGNGDADTAASPTDAATSAATAPPTAAPTVEPTAEVTTPPADLATAGTALTTAVSGSTCTDAWTDAQAFVAYQAAATEAGQAGSEAATTTAGNAISALQERCNARYATSVATEAGNTDAELSYLTASLDWRVPVEPAPAGASAATAFASPSGNINCTLSETGAVCAISSYDFAPPAGCAAGSPVTLVVDGSGARTDCGVAVGTGGPALGYGSATAVGDFACTSSESGMRCWDTLSGASFSVARAGGTTTDPVLGSVDG